MDRDAIARTQRLRQAQEVLEFERERASELEEQIEAIVAELEGPRIDEEAFAKMAPEDVAVVRSVLHFDGEPALEQDDWLGFEGMALEDEPTGGETVDDTEEEIVRLQAEVAESHRRQEVLERYVEALGG